MVMPAVRICRRWRPSSRELVLAMWISPSFVVPRCLTSSASGPYMPIASDHHERFARVFRSRTIVLGVNLCVLCEV